jgi:adsorption protein B
MDGGAIWGVLTPVLRETTLFAAAGFAIGGLDDLAVDALFLTRVVRRRARDHRDVFLAELPAPAMRVAMFVPAWDEASVIAPMLRTACERLPEAKLRIYVGVYPNDPDTMAAVARVARTDTRIRMAVSPRPGPTTKADCLNAVWQSMRADEEHDGVPFDAVLLHDAEDVVHPGEIAVGSFYLQDHDAVQLPVLPLVDPDSPLVAGTYVDEFAEAHGKLMCVRRAIGAGLPFAGVGCVIRREILARVADERGGEPFDANSLTEDYELGLAIAALGARVAFADVRDGEGGPPVAVRAFFPGTLEAAVRQKARWMIGIALAGWDRTGWGRATQLSEHWMRMRDRRAPLAMMVLFAAYLALLLWGAFYVREWVTGAPVPQAGPLMRWLLVLNGAMLVWRLVVRATFTTRLYGWRQGLLSLPRVFVGNAIALLAARRAIFRYVAMLRGARVRWDKTAHHFPTEVNAS